MLTFQETTRLGRRDFLRVGGLSLGGLAASGLNEARAISSERPLSEKSVVFLFLHGGPSQIETFDPHMFAPAEIRSATGEVQTTLPGVTFGASFPRLAARAEWLAIVRSFVTGDGNHDIKPVVGRESYGANLGNIYSQVAGGNHPGTGMPTNIALFPRAVEPSTGPVIEFDLKLT